MSITLHKHFKHILPLIVIASILILFTTGKAELYSTNEHHDAPHGEKEFLNNFQLALRSNDTSRVGGFLGYPQVYSFDCEDIVISSKEEFQKYYDLIITSDIREMILAQDYDSLLRNWQGILLGSGEVWLITSCTEFSESGECENWRTIAKIRPRLSEEKDCQQHIIDSVNSIWRALAIETAQRGDYFYGSWSVVRSLQTGISCLTENVIDELRQSPLFLDSTIMILDSVYFKTPKVTLQLIPFDSLVDFHYGSGFTWRRRAGLLSDSVIVLNVTCSLNPLVKNPKTERCFARDSYEHNFWVVNSNSMIWPVGGALLILERKVRID